MRALLFAVSLSLALVADAGAQVNYRADLDGAQENPPTGSAACGWASVTLNADNSVTYTMRLVDVNATAAHIHTGAVGVNGPVLVPLSGGPTVFSGTTAPLSAASVTDLHSGNLYINAHSAAFPGGEIRGQLHPATRRYGIHANGAQEVPANGSAATADGVFVVNPDRSITYSMTSSGISATASHIHVGAVGVSGGIVFPLSGGPTTFAGTTAPMTFAQWDALDRLQYYVNLHTAAFPGGEIRGQLVASERPYLDLPSCAPVVLDFGGTPAPGGTVNVSISNGRPSSVGYLLASLGPSLVKLNGEPLVVDPGLLFISTLVLPLDAAGQLSFSFVVPPFAVGGSVYWQFVNLDNTAPNGKFNVSNGVEQPLVALP